MVKQTEILFIGGSPRSCTSEELLGLVEAGAREAGARSRRFLLSKKHIVPCKGCGACSTNGVCVLAGLTRGGEPLDNYGELTDALERADALAVVSPLYFAGPPAQLKALYDRLQPYWARRYVLGEKPAVKRPAQLFILGGGGDSHGYEPLVTITKSALAVAGFAVEKVQNYIGYRANSEVRPLPSEEEATDMAFGELAHLRKSVALQADFRERAHAAGGAFARFVRKLLEKLELQAELRQVEAEIAQLKETDPVLCEPLPWRARSLSAQEHITLDFEALKAAARSSAPRDKRAGEAKAAVAPAQSATDQADRGKPPVGGEALRKTTHTPAREPGEAPRKATHTPARAEEPAVAQAADQAQDADTDGELAEGTAACPVEETADTDGELAEGTAAREGESGPLL
ncbi:MAG: flavodoxin family protein [Coriobacteriales bacterium]|jgi:multimeric flavodoxin WrbA|nr:flavodoxin family protein [Coriobacteriales bacterium]